MGYSNSDGAVPIGVDKKGKRVAGGYIYAGNTSWST